MGRLAARARGRLEEGIAAHLTTRQEAGAR